MLWPLAWCRVVPPVALCEPLCAVGCALLHMVLWQKPNPSKWDHFPVSYPAPSYIFSRVPETEDMLRARTGILSALLGPASLPAPSSNSCLPSQCLRLSGLTLSVLGGCESHVGPSVSLAGWRVRGWESERETRAEDLIYWNMAL